MAAEEEREGEREKVKGRWAGGGVRREKEAKQQRRGLKTEKRCQWRRL